MLKCVAVTQGEPSDELQPSQHVLHQLEQPQHIAQAFAQPPTVAGLGAAAAAVARQGGAETAQAQGDAHDLALRIATVAGSGSGSEGGGGGGGNAAAVTLSEGLAELAVGGAIEVQGAGGNDSSVGGTADAAPRSGVSQGRIGVH